jgi:uncharacterized protein YbjT (DUF2867 family)
MESAITGREPVLVTGATGTVGRNLVAQLLDAGSAVRALARNPGSAHLPAPAEVVRGDLADPATLRAALDGAGAVFLLWPFVTSEAAPAVIDVLAGGTPRIVFLSSMGASSDPAQEAGTAFHADVERLIRASGLEWTFLRAGGFAANTRVWAPQIRAGGVVRWPYAKAARSLIHERDIAAVAARALTEAGHAGASYVLTGPEALTQEDQVHAIGEAIARPLRYEEISPEDALRQMLADGWPRPFAEHALGYWATLVAEPEPVTRTVEQVTGSPPRTFREWSADHAADFR